MKSVKVTRRLAEALASIAASPRKAKIDSAVFGELLRGGYLTMDGALTATGREEAVKAQESARQAKQRSEDAG